MIFREKLSFDAHHTSIFTGIQQETRLHKLSGLATDDIAVRLAHSAAAHSLKQQRDRLVDVFRNRSCLLCIGMIVTAASFKLGFKVLTAD